MRIIVSSIFLCHLFFSPDTMMNDMSKLNVSCLQKFDLGLATNVFQCIHFFKMNITYTYVMFILKNSDCCITAQRQLI